MNQNGLRLFKYLLLPLLLALVSGNAFAQFGLDTKSYRSDYGISYAAPVEYTIAGVNVVGAQFNDKNALINIAGFKVGDKIKIPGEDISNAIKKLWRLGIVGDVSISVSEIKGSDVYLQIELSERPKLSKYSFEGIPKGQASTLEDKINLMRGRIVTDPMLKNSVNIIQKHYAEKGFKNCEVKVIKEKDPVLSNSIILKFVVNKKKKVKIDEIKLDGVEQIEEKVVKRKMKKTKEKRFYRIFTPSKFILEEYETDKANVIDFYNEEGYRNAQIVRDTVIDIIVDEKEMVRVEMEIDEGQRFYIRDINWVGNYKYTDEQLAAVLGFKKGDVYNKSELETRLTFNPQGRDVSALYMDDGYLFSRITPVEVLVEEDSIDIEMRVSEGEQTSISKILVSGNTKTSDHVIHREVRTLPGDKFNRSLLIRTQRELMQMGYFNPETIGINPLPNMSTGTVDIAYSLEEKPNDQIELSGGWGGFYGFVGTVGLVFNNFSLRNVGDFSKWRPLPSGDGQQLSLRVQANGKVYQTYSLSFVEPWLGGRKPNSLSVSFQYSVERLFDASNNVTGSLGIGGITVGLGRRLTWPDDWFTMSNSISYRIYNLDNFRATGFGSYDTGRSYNLAFNTTFARNSVDNPTYPRQGSQMQLQISLTPPYSVFSDKDFSDPEITNDDRFKLVEYHKWMFDNFWYQKLVGDLVLATRAHLGFLGSYNDEKGLGPFERFILGGDGITYQNYLLGTETIGLRGYPNGSIIPPSTNGEGGTVYNKYVLELRYPVSLNPSATIYVQGFAEAGNNWATFNEFNPFDLKRSAGFGARIFMPAFGMLGIDWGYGFDDVPGTGNIGGSQFHFTIGQTFR
ncbi:outer membrane protein assembly factor BamA [Sediminitomix flava]|uniref:Outer membrane protein assembly factor BamA n=1 Tax=Sediminitomix flava TaxID=379075 RepID=A0A315ZFR2_SEDFL|nr:outer membrane protein assembly factor BamA [Sediminitomix flava]PWJ44415.1 Beta-barrel assembly machine subunit BamA [Sediminitomix flava]